MEKQEILQVINDLGLSVEFEFVPYSKSRNYKKGAKVSDMSLNWKGHIKKNGREIAVVDYSAGIGHCPSYVQKWNRGFTLYEANLIKLECENGLYNYKPILPDTCDFFYVITMDCDVMEQPEFEEWAADCGYDPDSRKAEKIYNECLKTAMKINAAIGSKGLEKLREAF